MTCCTTNDAVVRGEKDIRSRLLCTCEMQGVIGAKAKRLKFPSASYGCVCQRHGLVRPSEYAPDTKPSFTIRCIVDLFFHDNTTDPLPFTSFTVFQNQKNRF
ncbi:MAG: hypothetical protein ETSY2_13270 [Candidatus Entotheonella gemina]|uniref:Uncharacterized protein n=1 Tax=Candidatus Entotheonella gemina TaxID=1429439 RepID=W4MA54_9BACT|nr:MAG: hypothetical protein ETSY2_13270 [Candidatus Entotheonella gemina]